MRAIVVSQDLRDGSTVDIFCNEYNDEGEMFVASRCLF